MSLYRQMERRSVDFWKYNQFWEMALSWNCSFSHPLPRSPSPPPPPPNLISRSILITPITVVSLTQEGRLLTRNRHLLLIISMRRFYAEGGKGGDLKKDFIELGNQEISYSFSKAKVSTFNLSRQSIKCESSFCGLSYASDPLIPLMGIFPRTEI